MLPLFAALERGTKRVVMREMEGGESGWVRGEGMWGGSGGAGAGEGRCGGTPGGKGVTAACTSLPPEPPA